MDENAMDFQEFEAAFGSGNQTDTGEAEETENQEPETEVSENEGAEAQQEAPTEPESGEDSDGDKIVGEDKNPPEGEQEFTIKVNKEEKTVSREEMFALAQKGADYDRVKSQVEKHRADNEALTKRLAETEEAYTMIEAAAKEAGNTVPEFLDRMRVGQIMKRDNCSEDLAWEKLRTAKAEKRVQELEKAGSKQTEEEAWKERMNREVSEFQKKFPDVKVDTLPLDRMTSDIQNGMSMTEAYLKDLSAQRDAEVKTLEAKLKAAEQKKRNKASSTGSANDSGGKAKTEYDDFWAAFH